MRRYMAWISYFCLFSLVAGCGGDSGDPTTGPIATNDLECEEVGYPCSLADTPTDVLEAAEAMVDEAWDQRDSGTMADVLAWLNANPDVVEAHGDLRAIRFRIEGSPPLWLIDDTGRNKSASDAPDPIVSAGEKAIVGEDTNSDAVIDNRDKKRALVLAPYLWQFSPHDESPIFADMLEGLPGYGGNVSYLSNPERSDQNISYTDYLTWADYDLIYLSTHGERVNYGAGVGVKVVVSTGVVIDWARSREITGRGLAVTAHYDDQGDASDRYLELGLTSDFFENLYPEGLDDTLVLFSACETGGTVGDDLAEAMSGDSFVLFSWSEVVDTDDAVAAMGVLMDNLTQGLTTRTSFQAVRDAGLDAVLNSDLNTTELQRHFSSGEDLRIIELPVLLDGRGDPLSDGTDISNLIDGTIGDGTADMMTMVVEVEGITEADKDLFTLRYSLGGADLPGTFGLDSATPTGDFRYRTIHEVDLGFDAQAGAAQQLQVVVDLPEGGESRYTVDVDLAEGGGGGHECNSYRPTEVAGNQNGEWTTPESQGSVSFTSPADPGGGYWTVNLSCDLPAVPNLTITSGSGTGHIFSQTNFGETNPQSITAVFEAGPSTGFTAHSIEASGANEDDHPINWSVSYHFTSIVDCYEPNQNMTEAKQLPLNIDNVEAYMLGAYRGSNDLDHEDLEDWYRLEVPHAGQLTVDLTQSPSDTRMRLRLYNEQEEQVALAGGDETGSLTTLSDDLQPGVYFLVAEAASTSSAGTNPETTDMHDRYTTPYLLNLVFE